MFCRINIGYLSLNFRPEISEYSSKFILTICLGRRSTQSFFSNPGKGTRHQKLQQIYYKSFEKMLGDFINHSLT
jgi:hypothetical protein